MTISVLRDRKLATFALIFNLREIILFSEVIFLVRYRDLLEFIDEIAPPHLESDWDNSGVQVNPDQENISKILIGLDPNLELIDQGVTREADLLLTHHPLIFSQLDNLNQGTLTGEKIFTLIQNEIGLISIHTPFDQSKRGLSQGLAEKLDLSSTRPLTNLMTNKLFKLEVFVPESDEDSVVKALTSAGAGKVGNYEESYYRLEAEGRFKPLETANPQRGQENKSESTKETRLDFLVDPKTKGRVISALKQSHPYEEPGFSLVETERPEPGVGLGRIGRWDSSRGTKEARSYVAEKLELDEDVVTVSGTLSSPVNWVASSPGSGGAVVKPAINSGVDLLITGELDYHERLEARERGLTVIEVGHYHSEKVFIPWTRDLLRERFPGDELRMEFHEEGI
ncbi:MAG: Nif3-like dinuclear metal center hexameric protein [Candidatus Bipolaricaulota bacterium]|nr:Nif3-like dinuclear metal center hexameric protein [Candidatus Bipolaricaulota bacterium]